MTVREIASDELIKLRGEKQYSEVFVIPRVPNVIYTARLASLPASTDMIASIAVESGSGTASNIRPDMKMLIGTSEGSDDLGFCRIRATPTLPGGTGNVKIGELSHIEWLAGCYLTVVDDYDIFPRHLKIVAGVPYIDYEQVYSDQHEDFDPIVNMGGHRVLLLDDGGTVSHQRSSATSQVIDGTISSRLWEAPNASGILNSTSATATITYDTPGHWVEYLTLTSNDGKTWTGVRYTFVVPKDTLSNISSLRVTESADGISFDFDMYDNASLSNFRYRAFAIAFARDRYNLVEESIGYEVGQENVLACGRISDERMIFNEEYGHMQFTVQDWKYWLGQVSSFPFGVERQNTSTGAWTSIPGLNVDRAVWDLLHHYSTITRICDLHLSGDTRYAEELQSANSNLAAQVDEISTTSIMAELVFDRFGSAWLRIEPQLIPETDRSAWVTVQEITSDDYAEALNIELNTYDESSQINSSGVGVSQYGTGTPYFSLSPGRIYSPYGSPSSRTNLLLASQAQSNSLAGLMLGWDNRRFESVEVTFVGNNRMFSIAEYCRAYIELTASNNPRGVEFTGNLIPRYIQTRWDDRSGFLEVQVSFQDESEEKLSVTGDFPEDAAMDEDFSADPFPNIAIPPLPLPITLPVDIENPNHPKKVIVATDQGVFYTVTFDEANPIWIKMNDGFQGDDAIEIANLEVCPNGAIYALTGSNVGWERVYRATLGGAWQLVFEASEYGGTDPRISGMGVSKEHEELVALIVGDEYENFGALDTHKIYVGSGGSFSAGDYMRHKFTDRFTPVLFSRGVWYAMGSRPTGIGGSLSSPRIWIYDAGGGLLSSADGVEWGVGAGAGAGSTFANGVAIPIIWGNGVEGYTIINDRLATDLTLITDSIDPNGLQAIAMSPSGEFGMGKAGATFVPYRTDDSAATWEVMSGIIPVGTDAWDSCGDKTRWVFAGGVVIRLTVDHGNTYYEKTGNLLLLAPLVDVGIIRYIDG